MAGDRCDTVPPTWFAAVGHGHILFIRLILRLEIWVIEGDWSVHKVLALGCVWRGPTINHSAVGKVLSPGGDWSAHKALALWG